MRKKVISAVTVSDSVIFFYGMPRFLSNRGYDVAICSASGEELDLISKNEAPTVFKVKMAREPKPLSDIISLIKVIIVLRKFKPDIVNAGTPKAGLIYMIASWLLSIPVRIYHVRGLRHESLTGFSEFFQIQIEKLTGLLATDIICETESLRKLALKQALYSNKKCHVLGPGSSGVELENYTSKNFSNKSKLNLRNKLGIDENALVIGFVGRLVPRKGVSELINAWLEIKEQFPTAILLLIGPMESEQPLLESDINIINNDSRIIATGRKNDVAQFYSIMDVFTLPAHWEGFGNVIIEAASMGVPVVTTNGTGTIDASKDGYHSKVINIKDSKGLATAISEYLENSKLRKEHGENGKLWAKTFERKKILEHLADFYDTLLT